MVTRSRPGIQDGFGWLPLSAAASRGHDECVVCLVKEGKAAIDAKAKDRTTALMWAARAGKIETIKCLLKLGADLDVDRRDNREDDEEREDAEWTARRHGKEDAAILLADVRAAGGWKKFAKEPGVVRKTLQYMFGGSRNNSEKRMTI